ncbi:MAG TPA: NAD(P)-dependent oxidoreductase [Patescibacteria group bacterium]|nr:NAD(P)-dependent oxidoreductase [Patescibacteria group bacterium]
MKKNTVLITGGSGFVGSHLVDYLLEKTNDNIVILDKIKPAQSLHKRVAYFQADIRNEKDVFDVFKKFGPFSTIYHLASAMPNKEVSNKAILETNIIGTRNLIQESARNHVKTFVFTSSNVTYGIPKELPVTEQTEPLPLETYGKSKILAEKELEKFKDKISIQILRCPVISGTGRLGLQAILFEFISENKNIYVLGSGSNKYQFVDVMDVCSALEKASHMKGFEIYNIGADNVLTLRQLYEEVIHFAKSSSKIIGIPYGPSLFFMSLLDKLNLSPLGVYQYTMIGRSIYYDTKKIKKQLHWQPKMTNLDTFIENYKWYLAHKGQFTEIGSGDFSANRSLPKMGILKLLKVFS